MRLLFVLFLFLISTIGSSNTIEGPGFVCVDVCYTYSIIGSSSTPVNWEVTNSSGSVVPFTVADDGLSIEVCFDESGDFTVSAGDDIDRLSINAGNFTETSLEIIEPISCQNQEVSGQSCFEICQGLRVVFRIREFVPDEMEWSFWGDGVVLSETNNTIEIQFDDNPGNAGIGYFGRIGDNCVFEGGQCIVLVEKPEAGFISTPDDSQDTITICQGQSITFESTSLANQVFWFGEGLGSGEGAVFQVRDLMSGSYQLTQQVSAGCLCSDSKSVIIEVLSSEGANIYCTSTACTGDTLRYSSDPGCAPYDWAIEGSGEIIEGGSSADDFVVVTWNAGPSGTIILSNGCSDTCPLPTREDIYIIGPGTAINGPTNICASQVYSFNVDPFDGTLINWSTSLGGAILSGQNSHKVTARFSGFTPAYIAVELEDCTRGCQHTDTLWLDIVQPYQINGSSLLCPDDAGVWMATSQSNDVLSTWTVLDDNGNTIYEENSPTATLNFSPTLGGSYTVIGRPVDADDYCNSSAMARFIVSRNVDDPIGIVGPNVICPNTYYSYTIEGGADPTLLYEWELIIDGNTTVMYGEEIRAQWTNSNNQSLNLRAIDPLTGCESNSILMTISILNNLDWMFEAEVCRFEEVVYELDSFITSGVVWEVNPEDKGILLGTPTPNSVRIKWQDSGTATLTANYCGITEDRIITIRSPLDPEVNRPDQVCGDSLIELSTVDSYSSYEWYREGLLVSTDPSFETNHGNYTLIVTDDAGCTDNTNFRIPLLRDPGLEIQTLESVAFCEGESIQINLTTSVSSDYEYTWYVNGVPISTNPSSVTATEFGEYVLEAVHIATGCRFVSNTIVTCELCTGEDTFCLNCPCFDGDSPPCDSEADDIDISITQLTLCNNFQFDINNINLIPGSVRWVVFEGGTFSVLTGESVNVEFDSYGRKKVCIGAEQESSTGDTLLMCGYCFFVEVEGVADFSENVFCADEDVVFFDESMFLSGASVDNYNWDFGDPASGGDNLSTLMDPTHTFSSSGTYSVSLNLDMASGCQLQTTKEVNVPDLPSASFMIDPPYCTDEPVESTASYSPAFYEWYFDAGTSDPNLNDISDRGVFRYDTPGSYDIRLEVTDYRGCTSSSSQTISINGFEDDVVISGDDAFPACEGEWVDLTVTNGPYTYEWNDGSTNPTVQANSSGPWSVTVTDSNGCSTVAGPVEAAYFPAPEVAILASVIGSGAVFSGDTLKICAGTAVQVWAIGPDDNRDYTWNNGSDQRVIRFDGNESELLEVGIHDFEVTVTDLVSSCEATSQPFYIQVFPLPDRPIVSTNPSEPLCEGEQITLTVTNPDTDNMYVWSNGTLSQSLLTSAAGEYQVTAINSFSCVSLSESVFIRPSPDVTFAPRGCQQACDEAVVCLPLPDGYALEDWRLDDSSIDLPTDPRQIIITESGTYSATISNSFGCEQTTPGITFDIFNEEADLEGIVFFDADGNGEYSNPPDSLLEGFKVYLVSNNTIVDSAFTDNQGSYLFEHLEGGEYIVIIGESTFPNDWLIFRDSIEVEMVACDSNRTAEPLILTICPDDEQTVEVNICPGDEIEIDGIFVSTDTTIIVERFVSGCTIIENYIVDVFPTRDTQFLNFQPCTGQVFDWEGQTFDQDTTVEVVLSDVNGCDSVIVANIAFNDNHMEMVNIELCPGENRLFRDIEISSDTIFTLLATGSGGECDTIFEVVSTMFPDWSLSLDIEDLPCPDSNDGTLVLNLTGIDMGTIAELNLNNTSIPIRDTLTGLTVGSYEVEVIDINGCIETATAELIARDRLVAEVPDVSIPCDGSGVFFEVSVISGDDGEVEFLWVDGTEGERFFVEQPGDYTVTVTNACESDIKIAKARPEITDENISTYVPNAFTPNRDEINDTFRPLFPSQTEIVEYHFEIFDRWGNRVFVTDEPEVGWDGFVRGQEPMLNVYVWKLQALVMFCGQLQVIKEHGDVLIYKQ